jgi:hypothetical protein
MITITIGETLGGRNRHFTNKIKIEESLGLLSQIKQLCGYIFVELMVMALGDTGGYH